MLNNVTDYQLLAVAAENALNLLTDLFPELRPDESHRDLDIALAIEQLKDALAGTDYELLDTTQAAETLQVSRSRILKLIASARLPAEKLGRDWLIRPEDIELVKVRRPGRPPRPV